MTAKEICVMPDFLDACTLPTTSLQRLTEEKRHLDMDDTTTMCSLDDEPSCNMLSSVTSSPPTPPVPPVGAQSVAILHAGRPGEIAKARTSLRDRRRTGKLKSLLVPGARPAQDLVGKKGCYTLGTLIGVGSASRVYRAVSPDGTQVALKKMVSEDDESRFVLEKEFNLLRSFDHENIVRCLDCGEDNTWMAMELLEPGENLTVVVQRDELSLKGACKVFLDLARAIAYLHSLTPPVVHRDIKPDNVLCHGAGALKYCPEIRLLDFNVAMSMYDSECLSPVGTYMYSAPEVLDYGAYGMPVDVWGVAATAFFAFSKTNIPTSSAVGEKDFASPVWERVSSSIIECLKECLLQDPSARPTASELEDRCRAF
jgi:serine/threonine protein kinase